MRPVLGLSTAPFSLEKIYEINGKNSADVMCKTARLHTVSHEDL